MDWILDNAKLIPTWSLVILAVATLVFLKIWERRNYTEVRTGSAQTYDTARAYRKLKAHGISCKLRTSTGGARTRIADARHVTQSLIVKKSQFGRAMEILNENN